MLHRHPLSVLRTLVRSLAHVLALALTASLAAPTAASACDVPVFRYALERWAGDPFQLVIFHDVDLPGAFTAALAAVEPDPDPQSKKVTPNWQILRVDTRKPIPKLWSALASAAHDAAPAAPIRAALCAPEWRLGDDALWLGALNPESLTQLSRSPKRQEIANHLLTSKSAVWIILETGDAAKDKLLTDRVAAESKRLEDTLPEPKNVVFDGINVLSPLPVTIGFATVRVNVKDPAEAMLVRMLTTGDIPTEPMLCPAFGRGRVLASLPASKVTTELLQETATFLTGACSCQVKAQNPGFDLLLDANWESIFGEGANAPSAEPSAPAAATKPAYVPVPKGRKRSQTDSAKAP